MILRAQTTPEQFMLAYFVLTTHTTNTNVMNCTPDGVAAVQAENRDTF